MHQQAQMIFSATEETLLQDSIPWMWLIFQLDFETKERYKNIVYMWRPCNVTKEKFAKQKLNFKTFNAKQFLVD